MVNMKDLRGRGNPYEHRYQQKIEKTLSLAEIKLCVDRVDNISLKVGSMTYGKLFLKSLVGVLYWTGLRKTEVIGAVPHRYKTQSGFKWTAKIPGILEGDITERNDRLYIKAIARKHGNRESPLILHLARSFADLIKEQWQKTEAYKRVWPIDEYRCWVLFKRVGFYPHYLRFNRITRLAEDPKNSLIDICRWTGLAPQTVSSYLAKSGRYTEEVAERMTV